MTKSKAKMLSLIALAAGVLGGSHLASAADMAFKAPAAAPFSWSGWYIGANGGAGWGLSNVTLNSGTGFPGSLPIGQVNQSGFVGGGQLGFNYQTGWVVLGVQGDFDAAGIKGTNCASLSGGLVAFSCESNIGWLATVSGRVGAVVLDRILPYVKVGAAWANDKWTASSPIFGGLGQPSVTVTHTGLLLGFGTEYAFDRHWSGFFEYNYMDLGTANPNINFAGGTFNAGLSLQLSVIKAGVNYRL
jgi:outer membrane immunogenic protein